MTFSEASFSYGDEGEVNETSTEGEETVDDDIIDEAMFEEELSNDLMAPPMSEMVVRAIQNENFEKVVDLIQIDLRNIDKIKGTENISTPLLTILLKRQMADIVAWRLKDPNKAINLYKENIETLKKYNATADSKVAEVEYYLIAQIYDEYGQKEKAQKLYKRFFEFSMPIAVDAIVNLTRKQGTNIAQKDIDLINETISEYSNFVMSGFSKNGVTKLRPHSYESSAFFSAFSLAIFSPSAIVELLLISEKPPFDLILSSPTNLSTEMSVFIAFQTKLMKEGLTKENLKAADGFLKKFPKSYFTMLMAHQLYWHYLDKGEKPKALKYYKILTAIEEERGIDIVLTRNKRLGTPEEVWKVFKRAVLDNDLKTVESLLLYGHHKTDNFDISKDNTISSKFAMIDKIQMHRESPTFVRFEIIYDFSDTEKSTFDVFFVKSYGEWRIDNGEHKDLPGIAGIGHHKSF